MMIEYFESIISTLFQPKEKKQGLSIFDPGEQFDEKRTDTSGIAGTLNSAFLISLAGSKHPAFERAKRFLALMSDSSEWADIAAFYTRGIELINREIETVCKMDSGFSNRLNRLYKWIQSKRDIYSPEETTESIWSVFFPEGNGILANKDQSIETLRTKRTVTITKLNAVPLTDPATQIIFTSNVLLTVPKLSKSPDELPFSGRLKRELIGITREPQAYWYDHPIPIGIEPEQNETLYGLKALDAALEFEKHRGNMSGDVRPICVLSVSVTHCGLHKIAKKYLEEEFLRSGDLKNLDIYVFTEEDTKRIIDEILAPAAAQYLKFKDAWESLNVFGVDGEYGRHYSFLKSIAAFWNIFIQPKTMATFKIDLDQVFPQKELVEQTGASALEHMKTPLWGAQGFDSNGESLELGMIAGALVNKQDIVKSLFTPDVVFPDRALSPNEYFFFSALPQALSTEAEMMTRYLNPELNGTNACIQRIHVTGGTTGILIDSLLRYRPFTPSFIGRAEDQAYILSVLSGSDTKLRYCHKDGFIMRHDKDTLSQETIQSAFVGKLIGDYVRILYFSAYANVLTKDMDKLKEAVDPFTGCFISKIPKTIVYLSFGLKAASFFTNNKAEQGFEFIKTGAKRLMKALEFVEGEDNMLKQQFKKERFGWDLYFDILSAAEHALKDKDSFALELREKAKTIIRECCINFESR